MGIFQKVSLRLAIILILLVLQIGAISFFMVFVVNTYTVVGYFGMVVSAVVLLFILKKDEASSYKISWLLIVLLIPAFGGVLYVLFGKEHRRRRKLIAHTKEHGLIAKLLDSDGNLSFISQVRCGRTYSLMKYIRNSSSYHAYKNTVATYYQFGELMFEAMLEELEKAEKFIFLEYFIISKSTMWDRLLQILEKKADAGVEVRLIVDDFGSQKLFTNNYISKLREKNIKVLRFNPLVPIILTFMNNRDHRKIMVVDGRTAFIGGLNIADEYINESSRFGVWKDTGLRLFGDGVWSFTLMFIEMWDTFCKTEERINNHSFYRRKWVNHELPSTDGFVIPYGDSPLSSDRLGENIYIDIISQAERYVYIFTPYLIISEKMNHTLQMAAKRGVDVRIVTPGIPDKKIVFRVTRSFYRRLQEAGVKIYEYTPGFLHAKSFVCDDKHAVIGTINLDYRSLYLHFECATLLYNSSAIEDLKNDAINTIAQSREMPIALRWKRFFYDLIDAFLHLFAPLM